VIGRFHQDVKSSDISGLMIEFPDDVFVGSAQWFGIFMIHLIFHFFKVLKGTHA
jgi:hypothetical protein